MAISILGISIKQRLDSLDRPQTDLLRMLHDIFGEKLDAAKLCKIIRGTCTEPMADRILQEIELVLQEWEERK